MHVCVCVCKCVSVCVCDDIEEQRNDDTRQRLENFLIITDITVTKTALTFGADPRPFTPLPDQIQRPEAGHPSPLSLSFFVPLKLSLSRRTALLPGWMYPGGGSCCLCLTRNKCDRMMKRARLSRNLNKDTKRKFRFDGRFEVVSRKTRNAHPHTKAKPSLMCACTRCVQ